MHYKDFDGWHKQKKEIDGSSTEAIPYFSEREIWFCAVGCNIGYEQDGKGEEFWRPVVIVRKYNKHLFAGIPLTSKIKTVPFYFGVGEVNSRAAMAILSQERAFSSKRLVNKLETMNEAVFEAMKKATKDFIFNG